MPRKPFICGNWKMNTTRAEAVALAEGTARAAADTPAVEVGACPPACYIEAVAAEAENTPMVVGGQNMYFEAKGAFTGEIAGPMLVDLGCEYVILGHSERRHVFGEPDDLIARKVKAAFAFGSYGWGKGGPEAVEEYLRAMKWEILREPLRAQFRPTREVLGECREAGKKLARKALQMAKG